MHSIHKVKKIARKHFIQTFNKYSPFYRDPINIILWKNSKGMFNTGNILQRTLTAAGFKARLMSNKTELPQFKSRINIFLQYIYPQYLNYAKHNILIPNPEWGDNDFQFIKNHFDCVIAKTRDCERIFKQGVENVYYTSFTSNDVYNEINPERKYIHFAGKSPLKGTKYIIDLWNRKQDLPKLHIYSYENNYKNNIKTDNIVFHYGRLTDADIIYLQNKYLFHISPSEYEGFGHQINESKSASAIVFTTDAPPMNELITDEFGFLVKANFKEKLKWANLYSVIENDLYEKIITSRDVTEKEIEEKRIKARESYKNNDLFFKERIVEIISNYF